MKIRLLIGLFTLAALVGCFGTDSNEKPDKVVLPEGFSSTCYWSQNSPIQDECSRSDESCIKSHYLEAGSRSGLEYECEDSILSNDQLS